MNLPNILSSVRIIVALVVPFFVVNGSMETRIIAGIICTIAVLTDWIDGWYARKYNMVTKVGKILDPIADKAFVITCLSVLVYLNIISIWWVVPIIIREIVITGYRFVFLERGTVVAAVKSGKVKTALQMFTIAIAYLILMTSKHFPEYFHFSYWWILYAALSLTLYVTLQSGFIFFKQNWRLVKRIHNLT